MAATDPNPNIRGIDRGARNVIIAAATATTGFAYTSPNLPANSIAYGRTHRPVGDMPANMTFQVDVTSNPTVTGTFLGSEDAANWYSIGTFNGAGIYPIAGVTPRYISASLDTLTGGTSPTVTVSVT